MKQFTRRANKSITSPACSPHSPPDSESGMIVFSSPTQILHMNGQARSLIALFGESRTAWTPPTHEAIPSIFIEFCCDVLERFRDRIDAHDWAQFEMRRVCHLVTPPLLIRGFGVPDPASQHPRVILTLHSLAHFTHHPPAEEGFKSIPRQTTSPFHATS